MEDLASALSFELRHEVATRYFGFRTQIERETNSYLSQLNSFDHTFQQPLLNALDLVNRALISPEFYKSFCTVLDLEFLYENANEPTPQSLPFPAEVRGVGLTRRGRYRDLCRRLTESVLTCLLMYQKEQTSLEEEYRHICHQMRTFERQNDLSLILSFFRQLDGRVEEQFPGLSISSDVSPATLNQELQFHPPKQPACTVSASPAQQFKDLKSQLNTIFDRAYHQHHATIRRTLPC